MQPIFHVFLQLSSIQVQALGWPIYEAWTGIRLDKDTLTGQNLEKLETTWY